MSRIIHFDPPRWLIGSRVPDKLLPSLGLLQSGGTFIDAGHDARLVNADLGPMDLPNILMLGQS